MVCSTVNAQLQGQRVNVGSEKDGEFLYQLLNRIGVEFLWYRKDHEVLRKIMRLVLYS